MGKFDLAKDHGKTTAEVVKKAGEEQAFAWMALGYYNWNHRKQRNVVNSAAMEIAKQDPRFKDLLDKAIEKAKKETKIA